MNSQCGLHKDVHKGANDTSNGTRQYDASFLRHLHTSRSLCDPFSWAGTVVWRWRGRGEELRGREDREGGRDGRGGAEGGPGVGGGRVGGLRQSYSRMIVLIVFSLSQ